MLRALRCSSVIVIALVASLVHFSAYPELFLSLRRGETAQLIPRKVLTSSRKEDKCKPLIDDGEDSRG